MYILNSQEKKTLKIIAKDTRIDYFRKKKILQELNIEEQVVCSDTRMEENLERKIDNEIQAEKFEKIFCDEKLSKIVKALTYNEKLVLSLYYIENKTDSEISEILFLTKSGITRKKIKSIRENKKRI